MKNKLLTVIFIILIVAAGAYLFWHYREAILNPKTPTVQNAPAMTVTEKTITDQTKPFKITIAYPQISGLDAFNQKIEMVVNQEVADFKKNSLRSYYYFNYRCRRVPVLALS